MQDIIINASNFLIPLLFLFIPLYAFIKKVPLFNTFAEGAAESIPLILKIFPFILGILVALAVFRASGAFEILINLIAPFCSLFGVPPEVVPLALMRPLSGSGALGFLAELLNNYGPDSFIGRLASVMQGSTDTTLYILAVYFGSIGITKYRYALLVGLLADLFSFIMAFVVCKYIFF